MNYDEFINKVQTGGSIDNRQDAETLTAIVLSTLAEPLSRDATNLLASQLPKELKDLLGSHREVPLPAERTMQTYSLEEFRNRVKARLSVSFHEGADLASVVTGVLAEAVTPAVIERVKQDLPPEYGPLFNTSG